MSEKKTKIGRPSIYAEKLEQSKKYLMGGWQEIGDSIPSLAGLACYLGVARETLYDWKSKEKAFSDILNEILTLQERTLLNGGLSKDFNPIITKLVLSKHGYSDKVEQDVTSSDGSMTPKAPVYKIVEE